jgi:hypothetical protein
VRNVRSVRNVRNVFSAISGLTVMALTCAAVVQAQTTAASRPLQRPAPAGSADQAFDPHDLSGIWWGHNARGVNSSLGSTAPPMTPWALQKYNAAKPGLGRGVRAQPLGNDPMMICDPMGFPRIMFWTNYPYEIVQVPNRVIMFFDWFYTYRTIWTDGRELAADPDPKWYGNSVGAWDGSTFVVRSNGFDDRSWLDADGHPHSEEMRLEERYRRVTRDTIEVTMTLTDPVAYTTPWVSEKMTLTLAEPKTQMREDVCVPSAEQKYKEVIRNPAGGATVVK